VEGMVVVVVAVVAAAAAATACSKTLSVSETIVVGLCCLRIDGVDMRLLSSRVWVDGPLSVSSNAVNEVTADGFIFVGGGSVVSILAVDCF